jgi:hypothetical protein
VRVLQLARLAGAFPLIGSVVCLLLHAASGIGNDDRRIFLAFLESV